MPTLFYVNTTIFPDAVTDARVEDDATVSRVLRVIWDEWEDRIGEKWPKCTRHWLRLVHLTDPVPGDSNLFDRMRDYPPELKKVLPPMTMVFHDLPSLARHAIHFELRIVDPDRREILETTIAGKAHLNVMANVTSNSPSTIANDPHLLKIEQTERPIYNGRSIHLEGPPITIYAPPFARIKEKVKNLDTVHLEQNDINMLEITGLLYLAGGKIYDSEGEREHAVYPLLCTLLDVEIYAREPIPGMEIDGVSYVDVTALNEKACATALYVELRNELGMKGASGIQLAWTYQKRISMDDHRDVRAVSCCPAILMTVAGTDIRFYGAVFADVLIVQPLTDTLSLSGDPDVEERIGHAAKVFQVIRDGYRDLSEWYRALRPTVASPYPVHILPNPTLAPTAPPLPFPLSFLDRFDFTGRYRASRDADTIIEDFRCALFRAQFGESEVLVKFCFSYCERAHRLLAEHDPPLAPKLHACVRLLGGVTMVVMDIVPGFDNAATKYHNLELPAEVFEEVSMAVKLLHDAGLVHGDLRRPNIMPLERESGRMGAMLLDFNWAGEDGQVRYPALLNQSGQIKWADGVKPGRPIRMQHDKDMLARLL